MSPNNPIQDYLRMGSVDHICTSDIVASLRVGVVPKIVSFLNSIDDIYRERPYNLVLSYQDLSPTRSRDDPACQLKMQIYVLYASQRRLS